MTSLKASHHIAAGLRELAGSSNPATWPEVESLVTDGYAWVLALEAERLRVMRELVDLAKSHDTAAQAAVLTSELDGIGAELAGLRTTLTAVRRRFTPGNGNGKDVATQPATGWLRHELP